MRFASQMVKQSRHAAIVAFAVLLVWFSLPTIHFLTFVDCHSASSCPICQTINHTWQLDPDDTTVLAAPNLVASGMVAPPAAPAPNAAAGLAQDSRAPPA